MTQYQFDADGQSLVAGQPDLSADEIRRRLSEWQCMADQLSELGRKLLASEVRATENMSAYKKRMRPRMDDADRFVALATAYVTQDPKFAALCDNATLHPTTVDAVRHAVDIARAPFGGTCPDCGCEISGWHQDHKPDCEHLPL